MARNIAILLLLMMVGPASAQTPERGSASQPATSQPAESPDKASPSTEEPASAPTSATPSSQPSEAVTEGQGEAAAAPPPTADLQVHEAEHTPPGPRKAGLMEEDLDTERVLLRRRGFSLQMGGMLQVQGAFYVGDEAGLVLDDPADTEGFRVRRARFGFGGSLFTHWGYYLAVDLKDTVVAAQGGDYGNEILDAKIDWHRFRFARVSVGVDKVPFSAFALQSSSRLTLIERPLMVGLIAPNRRVGLTVEGDLVGLQYAVGLYNGSEGVTSGNRMAGVAGAAHLQYNILGKPESFVPSRIRLGLGGGYMYDDGPAVADHRASANLAVQGFRVRLQGELLWMQSDPKGEPTGSEIIAGDATRWGVAAELSAFVLPGRWSEYLQVVTRYEYYQDVEELVTLGNQQLITAGLNLYLFRHNLKLQINYIHRDEREGTEMANDVGFAQIQAMF